MDFAKLKALSGKKGLEALSVELNKISGNDNTKKGDDRFWKPTVDKAGNGYAVIRFLPAPDGEDVPFVRLFDHGFQGPTGLWYIENSLTTIGQQDPVSEYNSKLWNSSDSDESAERKQARKQKRRLYYFSNIYVVSDPSAPENEGKVFLFKYGKKIFNKLNEAMNPSFADEEAMNPFDLWTGANFKLKIRQVEGYRNYEKSEFGKSEPLFKKDEEMMEVYKKEYKLQEFLDPKNFKSYDELSKRLANVLNQSGTSVPRAETKVLEETAAPKQKEINPNAESFPPDESDDEELQFFKNLAK